MRDRFEREIICKRKYVLRDNTLKVNMEGVEERVTCGTILLKKLKGSKREQFSGESRG